MNLTRTFADTFLLCLLLVTGTYSAAAASMVSVSASTTASTCSQTNASSAGCSVSATNGSQTATASASGTDTWAFNGSGSLEASAFGFGPGTNGQSAVFFSNLLIITGAAGSGNLKIDFSGFQMNTLNIPGSASVSPVEVTLAGFATSATLPNGSPQAFAVVAPVAFNSPELFSVAFSATAAGTFFHNGNYAVDSADGILLFPTFVVTDSAGNPLSNTSAQFVPEPASWSLGTLGLLTLVCVSRSAVSIRETRRSVPAALCDRKKS